MYRHSNNEHERMQRSTNGDAAGESRTAADGDGDVSERPVSIPLVESDGK